MYDCSYQAMQIQEKNFYCFYKLTFPRKKMFVMALIKGEILILLFSPKTNKQKERWQGHRNSCGQLQRARPVAKSCTGNLARVISSCFAKMMLSKIRIFLKRKKLTQHV